MNPIVQIATEEIGIEEEPKGSNCGPRVEEYLASVGLGKGYSWCMAFAYWCAEKAAELDPTYENKLEKTGGVLYQLHQSHDLVTLLPEEGDIFIMDFGHGNGHAGIVTSVHNGTIKTIEGNSNSGGSREGYQVAQRERAIPTIKAFLRNPYTPKPIA